MSKIARVFPVPSKPASKAMSAPMSGILSARVALLIPLGCICFTRGELYNFSKESFVTVKATKGEYLNLYDNLEMSGKESINLFCTFLIFSRCTLTLLIEESFPSGWKSVSNSMMTRILPRSSISFRIFLKFDRALSSKFLIFS